MFGLVRFYRRRMSGYCAETVGLPWQGGWITVMSGDVVCWGWHRGDKGCGVLEMVDHPKQGFPEGGAAGEDNEPSDRDEHRPGRKFAGETGRDGGGDNAAGDQSGDVEEGDAAEQDEKGDGAGEDDKEFGQADGANDITRVFALGDQGAGDEGAPAATGKSIHKTTDGGQPASPADLVPGFSAGECFSDDIIAKVDGVKG